MLTKPPGAPGPTWRTAEVYWESTNGGVEENAGTASVRSPATVAQSPASTVLTPAPTVLTPASTVPSPATLVPTPTTAVPSPASLVISPATTVPSPKAPVSPQSVAVTIEKNEITRSNPYPRLCSKQKRISAHGCTQTSFSEEQSGSIRTEMCSSSGGPGLLVDQSAPTPEVSVKKSTKTQGTMTKRKKSSWPEGISEGSKSCKVRRSVSCHPGLKTTKDGVQNGRQRRLAGTNLCSTEEETEFSGRSPDPEERVNQFFRGNSFLLNYSGNWNR